MGLVGCDKQAIKPDKLILSIAFNESRGGNGEREGGGGIFPYPEPGAKGVW